MTAMKFPAGPAEGFWSTSGTTGGVMCGMCGTHWPELDDDGTENYGLIEIGEVLIVDRCCGKLVDDVYHSCFYRLFLQIMKDWKEGGDQWASISRDIASFASQRRTALNQELRSLDEAGETPLANVVSHVLGTTLSLINDLEKDKDLKGKIDYDKVIGVMGGVTVALEALKPATGDAWPNTHAGENL